MAISAYCSCYSDIAASNLCLYAETEDGKFGTYVVGSQTAVQVSTTSSTQLRLAATPKNDSYYCNGWASTASTSTATNYGLLTITKTDTYTTHNKAKATMSSGLCQLTVKDDHGTHTGVATGTWKMHSSQVIAVKHESESAGYSFTGWKITFKRTTGTSYPQFVSTFGSGEATTSGTVTTVSAAYSKKYAIVMNIGSSSLSTYAVTIEAMYESGTVYHTLSYDANGGSPTPESQQAASGELVTLAPKPSNAPSGKTFGGWLLTGETNPRGENTTFNMPASDVVATAQWQTSTKTYRLNYYLNGGSPSYSQQSCQTGGFIELQGNPTKSGQDFGGWVITKGTTSGEVVDRDKFAGYKFYPSGDTTTFYASATWTAAQPHTLTYETGYSGGTPPAAVTDIYAGTTVTLASALSRVGYTFNGWYLSHTSSIVSAGSTFTMPAQDVTATGRWTAQTVVLTYYHGYDSGTYGTQSGKTGTTITLKAKQTRSGYNFIGWLIKDSTEGDQSTRTYQAGASYTLKSTATATALWSPLTTYIVQYNKNASDVSGDDIPTQTVSQGNQVEIRSPDLWSRPNYAFVSWNTSSGGTGTSYKPGDFVYPTGNITLNAIWTATGAVGGAKPDTHTENSTSGQDWTHYNRTSDTKYYNISLWSNISAASITVGIRYYGWRASYLNDTKTSESSPSAMTTTTVAVGLGSGIQIVQIPSQYTDGYISHSNSYYYGRDTSKYLGYNEKVDYSVSKSDSIFDHMNIEAAELENYEFKGWYTVGTSKDTKTTESVSSSDFVTLVSRNRILLESEMIKKVNHYLTDYENYSAESSSEKRTRVRYVYNNFLMAKYLGKKVVVLFDAGDGEVEPFFKEVRYDSTYGDLPEPTPPAGYSFSGWYTASTGGSSVSSTTSVTNPEDHTLYARYTSSGSLSVTVTFNGMGGTPSYSTRSYTAGSTYTTLPTGSYSGKSLAGWYTGAFDGTKVETNSTVSSYNHTLYARWTTTMYTITLNANGGTVSKSSIQVVAGSPLTWIPTPTHATDTFVGWFTSAVGGNEVLTTTVPTGNMTIHAHWETGGGGGGGGGGGSSESSSVQRGYVRYYGMALHYNGGTLSSSYRKRYDTKTGKDLPTSTEITKSSAAFLGWYRDAALTDGPVSSIPAGTTGKVEFYAKWFE